MTATQKLALVVVLWMLIGVIASVVMGRRGHGSFTWLLLGAVLGPLVIPVGLSAERSARRPDPRLQARRLREGGSGAGPVDVLVGIDGSDRSIEALRAAVGLFSEGIGRLTLAGVIDYDSARASRTWRNEQAAAEDLERAAAVVQVVPPTIVILAGRPADALARYAAENGFEVLVVGRRGHGAGKALLGSTAVSLSRQAGVPVLIV